MSLQTPTTIRTRQWKLISQGEETLSAGVSSLDTSIERPTIVGLVVKPIGKPSAGNRHARFDERGWETGSPINNGKRCASRKGGASEEFMAWRHTPSRRSPRVGRTILLIFRR